MTARLTAEQRAALDGLLAVFEAETVADAIDAALSAVESVADTGGNDYSPIPDLDRAYQAGWSDAIAACASEVADLT